jgi:hypothetical protein
MDGGTYVDSAHFTEDEGRMQPSKLCIQNGATDVEKHHNWNWIEN